MSETMNLVVPAEVVLRHRESEWNEEQVKVTSEQMRKARAVLFLDKVQHEKTLKELEPLRVQAEQNIARLQSELNQAGASLVGDLKPSEEFAEVKKALRALRIYDTVFQIRLVEVEIENGTVQFTRSLGLKESSYRSDMISGSDRLKFTPEMKKLRTEWQDEVAKLKSIEQQLVEARTALRDRANRMSDVEGAIALKSLNAEEQVEVKELYTQLATGLNAQKLLGEKKA